MNNENVNCIWAVSLSCTLSGEFYNLNLMQQSIQQI